MNGFILCAPDFRPIHFRYYKEEAPETCSAFENLLPLFKEFYHARVSGQEIWFEGLEPLFIPQENASVFTLPGEVVLGPAKPVRTKTANCFGIYYGEGKGLDACNIFARVVPEDLKYLQELGESIWKNGSLQLELSVWK